MERTAGIVEIEELTRQHRLIMVLATHLRGCADRVLTRQDACEVRVDIVRLDRMLVCHLKYEDEHLYPALMACEDLAVAAMAADCAEEMGGIEGAWVAYRSQWTAAAIQAAPERFAVATAGVIGALAMRVDRENTQLYPAAEALHLVRPADQWAA